MFTCNASSLPNIDYINFGKTRTTFDDSIFTSEVNLLWLQKPLEMASMISKLIELGIHPITCYQICSIILFNNSPMILQNTDIFRHLHQVCQLNVFHFQYMISFYSIMLTLSCTDNFQPSADFQSCVCLKFLSADKSKCVKSCEEIGETSFDGRCVKAIGLKSAVSNDDCVILYNQGSIWDGASGCKCDNANGYAGESNSFCTDCKRLGQYADGSSCVSCSANQVLQVTQCNDCPPGLIPSFDKTQCVTCAFRFGTGSIPSYTGTCECNSQNGFAGMYNSLCEDCWQKGQIVNVATNMCEQCQVEWNQIFKNGRCEQCFDGQVPSIDGRSCINCNQKYGIGSIYDFNGFCSCDRANGFASHSANQVCTDCFRADKQDKSACQSTCNQLKEIWNFDQNKCICNAAFGYGGVSGVCSCDINKGYTGTDSCTSCWDQAKIATQSGCQDCPVHEIFRASSIQKCICDYFNGYAGISGACTCSQPDFALYQGICTNCTSVDLIFTYSGCQTCPEFEKYNQSSKTCYCISHFGYAGVSGGCYCNFEIGLTKIVDSNGVKSCGCNQYMGNVPYDDNPDTLICKCDTSTGHAGQPGACFCDSSTGHFGYPGFCMCNFNLQFVGSAGSCKNCAALNAHASQFNGAYFCRCNGDSGYGSPDAGGTCRLCASANSVVQVDSQGQFQCVACAATEKVVKNMCVGA
ncbi:Cysteine-rich_membrane protein 1 [Hexamita inflata]|uniref:Cysteine-rich membrane protein 1 n=1 Tax=Hexamita inflata TaxID=28002 RepID=A0AA86QHD6_9EUKA|nr:Cysteine-rich membrane protein 1 [Hexamita inflata]